MYRSMIGSLIYVKTSRTYVLHVVVQVVRFQEALKQNHILVVKIIFRYIQRTTDFGLWYPKGNELSIFAYIDTNR